MDREWRFKPTDWSIDEENNDGDRLAYAMQLGSGTYDINLGTTYTAQLASFSYGAQALGTFRLGENSNGYTLGNQYNAPAGFKNRLLMRLVCLLVAPPKLLTILVAAIQH